MRQKARESLLAFTQYTHPKWVTQRHHYKICHYLEKLEQRATCPHCGSPINKLAIFAPPRSGKTELSLRRFSAWAMGRNPGWHVISAMANGSLAADTGGETRDIVGTPKYRNVFPKTRLKEDAKAANRWIIENDSLHGVYYCGGIDSSFPGRGANILNIDDPHKSSREADSSVERENVWKTYAGDLIHRYEDPAMTLLTNTRRHQDDLAGRILPNEQSWSCGNDPQFFCCGNGWHVLRMRGIENEGLPEEYALHSQSVQSEETSLQYMRRMKAFYERKGQMRYWHSEYQQTPTPEQGVFIKRAWLDEAVYDVAPENLWIYMTSDVAVTKKEGSGDPDFTEHGVFGLSGVTEEYEYTDDGAEIVHVTVDEVFVLDWWYGQTTPDVWIAELVRLMKMWKPAAWFGTKGVIRNAVEGYLEREMLQQRAYVPLEWLSDVKDKAAKARPLQGMCSMRRFRFPAYEPDPEAPWVARVKNNLISFPSAVHDDAFDTCANMARALGDIPAAFSGAPPPPKEKTDSWEYADNDRVASWKGY